MQADKFDNGGDMMSDKSIPKVKCRLVNDDGCWQWHVLRCCYCGGEHWHGAGDGSDPTSLLGHRLAHCSTDNVGYVLVDNRLRTGTK